MLQRCIPGEPRGEALAGAPRAEATPRRFSASAPRRKKPHWEMKCIHSKNIQKHFKKQYLATPLKRQVDVEQICNAVDFFIKNISITGQVLAIDSGQNLNWQTPDVMGKE